MSIVAQLGDARSLSSAALAFYQRTLVRAPAFMRATDDAGTYVIAAWDEQTGTGRAYRVAEGALPRGDAAMALQAAATALMAVGDPALAAPIITLTPLYLAQPTAERWTELRNKYVQLVDSARIPASQGGSLTTVVAIAAAGALLAGGYWLYRKAL